MREFNGDLLIGGMRLPQVHGELEEEQRQDGARDWSLSGRLRLASEQGELLELNRQYRLQLEDGRAGQVYICRIERAHADELLAEFLPRKD